MAFLLVRSDCTDAFPSLYTAYSPGILGDLLVQGLLFHHQIQEAQGDPVFQEHRLYLHHLGAPLAQEDLALHLSLARPAIQTASQNYI